jgi:hypothetical protein
MGTQYNLETFAGLISHITTKVESIFFRIPGSVVLLRYIKSSHQNDPGRTLLEVILIIFAVRTLLQSRTRADRSGSNFVQLTEAVLTLLFTQKNLLMKLSRKLTNSSENGNQNLYLKSRVKET